MGFRQNMNSGIAICMFQISQARNHNIQRGLAVRCGGRWVALVVVGEEICVVPWWFHAGFMPVSWGMKPHRFQACARSGWFHTRFHTWFHMGIHWLYSTERWETIPQYINLFNMDTCMSSILDTYSASIFFRFHSGFIVVS